MGIHFRSAHILKQPIDPENPVYAYNMDGASGAASSGSDAVESLTSLWQEAEFISADEILFEADQASLQLMQKVCVFVPVSFSYINCLCCRFNYCVTIRG